MSRGKRKADDKASLFRVFEESGEPHRLMNLAAELGHEDGGDPKEFHDKPWNSPKKASRKGQQLCGQVKDALTTILPTCGDETLQTLEVAAVEPAPHTGRLLVLLRTLPEVAYDVAMEALHRATGFLRSEVAQAICRRHAPELIFEVIGR